MNSVYARDHRFVRHRAGAGGWLPAIRAERPHVVVVGGGIAGLSAATGLVERGVRVTVLEREAYLGGRAGGWSERLDDGSWIAMSRGFHAFFRQYYNLRALLRRADPLLRMLTPVADYPLIDAHGRRDTFRGLPRTPPWNALAFALRSPTFSVRDLLALDPRAAAPLAAVSVPATYRRLDHLDAESFLRRINFPEPARHLAFEVFARSFFVPPAELSAAELAIMFHIYFLGSSEGLVFDVPNASFEASLWQPLREYLERHTADIRCGVPVTAVDAAGKRSWRVHGADGACIEADGVVLATDVTGLQGIVAASPELSGSAWRASVAGLRTAPPFLVQRVWLDRPVAPERPSFLGTGGLAPLDNISVLERHEREATRWARQNHGSVVELHGYAAAEQHRGDAADVDTLRARLLTRMRQVYPETGTANIVGERVQWRQDCPLFGIGDFARRPSVRTPHTNLVLAGDAIRVDLPVALMERAATTGWHAANCLLARWGLAGHELFSVPTSGRLAPLRWLAERVTEGVP